MLIYLMWKSGVLTDEADIGFMGSESTIYTYAGGTQDYVVKALKAV